MPEIFTVHAASLDDPSRYELQMVTSRVRGYCWDHLDAAGPKFDKMSRDCTFAQFSAISSVAAAACRGWRD